MPLWNTWEMNGLIRSCSNEWFCVQKIPQWLLGSLLCSGDPSHIDKLIIWVLRGILNESEGNGSIGEESWHLYFLHSWLMVFAIVIMSIFKYSNLLLPTMCSSKCVRITHRPWIHPDNAAFAFLLIELCQPVVWEKPGLTNLQSYLGI